jgi:L-ribulose-5-phosphate 4-epimerase
MAQPPVTPPPDSIELRWEVIRTCFLMRDRLGFFMGTWGSVSVRLEDGLLVTPSRMKYEDVKPEDLVVVDWEGKVLRGRRQPTTDNELHRQLLLQRLDLGALIHSHSPWASVCACSHRPIPVLTDDMAAVIGGEVRSTRYVPAGRERELAQAAREAIGPDACALLLANHGVVAGGRDLAEAIVASQIIERAAMIFIQAEAIGGITPISEQHWRGERVRYLEQPSKLEGPLPLSPRPLVAPSPPAQEPQS